MLGIKINIQLTKKRVLKDGLNILIAKSVTLLKTTIDVANTANKKINNFPTSILIPVNITSKLFLLLSLQPLKLRQNALSTIS